MAVTYDLRRSLTGQNDWTVIAEGISADYLIDSGLADDAGYDYQFRACNEFGCSEWSATVTVTIPDESDPPTITYDLRRSPENENDWTVIATGLTLTAYLDELVSPETGYDYQVRACQSGVCSDWSASVNVTTPEGPMPPLVGTAVGTGAASATLTILVPLAGTAAGTGHATGTLRIDTGVNDLAGTSVGTGATEGALHVTHNLSGTATGTGHTEGDLTRVERVPLPLAGESVGTGHSTANLRVVDSGILFLAGTSIGTGAATANTHTARRLRGRAVGEGAVIHRYLGPGSGIVGGAEIALLETVKSGDSFPVHLPWAGLWGMSGIARVLSITIKGGQRDITAQFVPMPDERLIPGLSKGEPIRYTKPTENDPWTLTRENQRELRRVKREQRRERRP